MNNFHKQLALLVLNALDNTTTPGQALLGDQQRTNIWKITNPMSNRARYQSALAIPPDLPMGSITVLRDGGVGEFKTKTTWGSGTVVDGTGTDLPEDTFVAEISVFADTIKQKTAWVGKIDLMKLTSELTVNKTAGMWENMMTKLDVDFFKYVCGLRTSVAPANATTESRDPNTLKHYIGQTFNGDLIPGVRGIPLSSGQVIVTNDNFDGVGQTLVGVASLLRDLRRDTRGLFGGTGISGINENSIFIDMVPDLFSKFIQKFGLITVTPSIVTSTPSRVTEWGGYTFYENTSLRGVTTQDGKPVAAIVGTGSVGVAPWTLVSNVIKQPTPSEDSTMYLEYKHNAAGGRVIFDAHVIVTFSLTQDTYETELAAFLAYLNAGNIVAANGAPLAAPTQTYARAYTGAATVIDPAAITIVSTTPVNAATVTAATAFTGQVLVPVKTGSDAVARQGAFTAHYTNT